MFRPDVCESNRGRVFKYDMFTMAMYSTWYVNVYIYSRSYTVHGMLIFTFTADPVQYMVC